MRDLRAGQRAQGIAAHPAGRARLRFLEATSDGDRCRVQLGVALPDRADSLAHRLLHEVALVMRLALGADEIAVEQFGGGALIFAGHLRHQHKAGPRDELR